MSDSQELPAERAYNEECELRLQKLEDSVGMLLVSHEALREADDTRTATLRQLRHQVESLRTEMVNLSRLGVLVEAADQRSQRLLAAFGKVEELLEHTLTQIGNGRGGK